MESQYTEALDQPLDDYEDGATIEMELAPALGLVQTVTVERVRDLDESCYVGLKCDPYFEVLSEAAKDAVDKRLSLSMLGLPRYVSVEQKSAESVVVR